MKYILRARILDPAPTIEITAEEFNSLREARSTLAAAFALEEIFNLLLGNYRELEVSALKIATDEMVHWKFSYGDHFEVRNELNRRTVNFLSASRLYVDQVQQWVRDTGADSSTVKNALSSEYDKFFEYRFVEALRNHVQHCGRAVHGVTTGSKWTPPGKRECLEFSVTPYASKNEIAQDKKFKKSVLAECDDQVMLLPAIRRYVESIGHVHRVVRSEVDPLTAVAASSFQQKLDMYKEVAGQVFPGLHAFAEQDGVEVENVPVFLEWEDVRRNLAKRNSSMASLSKSFVTSHPAA